MLKTNGQVYNIRHVYQYSVAQASVRYTYLPVRTLHVLRVETACKPCTACAHESSPPRCPHPRGSSTVAAGRAPLVGHGPCGAMVSAPAAEVLPVEEYSMMTRCALNSPVIGHCGESLSMARCEIPNYRRTARSSAGPAASPSPSGPKNSVIIIITTTTTTAVAAAAAAATTTATNPARVPGGGGGKHARPHGRRSRGRALARVHCQSAAATRDLQSDPRPELSQ